MRFELMAFSFGGRRSNPLSYEALEKKFTRNCAGCQVKSSGGKTQWLDRAVNTSGEYERRIRAVENHSLGEAPSG